MPSRITECPVTSFAKIEEMPTTGDYRKILCPALGGTYTLTGSAEAVLRGIFPEGKAKLATWIIDQHRLGTPIPAITSSVLEHTEARPPLSMIERLHRLYRYLRSKQPNLSDALVWKRSELQSAETNEQVDVNLAGGMAWTESITRADLNSLVEYGKTKGNIASGRLTNYICLTFDGWHLLEQLDQVNNASD